MIHHVPRSLVYFLKQSVSCIQFHTFHETPYIIFGAGNNPQLFLKQIPCYIQLHGFNETSYIKISVAIHISLQVKTLLRLVPWFLWDTMYHHLSSDQFPLEAKTTQCFLYTMHHDFLESPTILFKTYMYQELGSVQRFVFMTHPISWSLQRATALFKQSLRYVPG